MSDEHAVQTIVTWALTAVMSVVLYLGLYTENQTTQRIAGAALTQSVCSQANQVNGLKSETECGNLQDKYNVEFLCSNGACWTEMK